ncbi:MAG: hypothetical protein E7331_11720 [Clostridiales bacterium]|nr:hypothetical protein [Clostridiales bacterium]
MLYLFLAIVSSMLVSVMMRISEKYTGEGAGKLAVNYVMCCLLAWAFSGGMEIFPRQEGLSTTLLLGVVNGFLYLAGFVMLQWNISRNGVVLPSTFMKLGVVVPTLMAILVFREQPRLTQAAGLLLAVAAIFVIQGAGEKRRAGGVSIGGLLLLLLTGGSADAMSKVFEEVGPQRLKDQFLLYTFAVALILCVVLVVVKKQRFGWKDVAFGLLIGIPNYFSARFLLLALGGVPAMIVYPSFSVGTIVLVALAGVLLFREKLNRRKIIGLLLILAALVLLNV